MTDTSLMYRLNSVGDNTAPCGTPHLIIFFSEMKSSTFTIKFISFKQDIIHFVRYNGSLISMSL
jgi:hypothetical protein